MASMQDGLNFTAPPYGKVLLLGAIAAASAFVVTILIVVLCVGCQRKGKTHNVPGEGGKHRLMDMGILRQSKLRSISKSDTEMNKMNCNGKSRQLPQIPSGTGEEGEHTYSEVGRSSSTHFQLHLISMTTGQTPYADEDHEMQLKVEKLEVMFMGNGEQYIWKPPEEEEMAMHQTKALGPLSAHTVENIQPAATVVAEMYSKVCKPGKKKRAMPGSPPANPGFRTLGRGDRDRDRDGGFSVVVKPQTWALQEGKAVGGPLVDHCYESIGTEECDLAYENMEGGGAWKRERPPNTCATLRPRRKKAQQPLQQQQPPPPPPTQQTPKLQHLPAKALLLPGENLYESIGDLKQGSATSSTTTIFTFNDGMEMYVTGL
ncbi:uncharacterized protein si:dkey-70p6.1 [Etheostoma cragini]|uniref:uncharacterized protein si:dkey-70p6.1 n=1 Tax=Etheostoma cragini TaxID=417921 RepID=UPI00155E3EF9|nr:uncharacterized protein si:dkey-70p6.1 [Etheostoma cragini]